MTQAATIFDDTPRQVVNTDGSLVGSLPDLATDKLLEIYRLMVLTRTLDRKLTSMALQGTAGDYYQNEGMEAHVAAAMALGDEDWVFPAYRDMGVWLTRGLPLESVIRLWKGIPACGWDVNKLGLARLNATIGTHLPHATGFAYASRAFGRNQVSMAVFGDGGTSEGDFHAALNFAGVWKTPTLFLCQNNLWAEETPIEKQTASKSLAQKALAYGIEGVVVDGMDAVAVYEVTAEAARRAREGGGATLIEMLTYRFGPHFMAAYDPRPKEQIAEFKARDAVTRLSRLLINQGHLTEDENQVMRDELKVTVDAAVERVEKELDANGSPATDYPIRHVYERIPQQLVEQLQVRTGAENATAMGISPEDIWDIGPELMPASAATASMNICQALNTALTEGMEKYPEMIVLGEDVALVGGQFRVTKGLLEKFGESRVIDTPLCETGIIGTAVGMAMAGARVVPEIMFAGFSYPAMDQIIGHVARMRFRYGGQISMPLVIRMGGAGGFKGMEFHNDTPESYFVHTPGLIVVMPSTPVDAKGLMAAALNSNDPVIFIEPLVMYNAPKEDVPVDYYATPLGRAKVRRAGADVTVVTYGTLVPVALEAAEQTSASVEVIDLRTLYPWDEQLVLKSVEKTGRLVVVHEAASACGVGAEIAACIAEKALYSLKSPIVRVTGLDAPRTVGSFEELILIRAQDVKAGIERAVAT